MKQIRFKYVKIGCEFWHDGYWYKKTDKDVGKSIDGNGFFSPNWATYGLEIGDINVEIEEEEEDDSE